MADGSGTATMATSVAPTKQPEQRDVGAFLSPPELRDELLGDVAPVAIAFDLHRWRDAVRGDEAGELILLWVLHAGGVGEPAPDESVASELDARLAAVAAPPADVDPSQLELRLEHARDEATANGDRLGAARRYLRARTLLGGVRADLAAAPAADLAAEMGARSGGRPSVAELAQLVVADGRLIASGARDRATLEAASDQLALAQRRVGAFVPRNAAPSPDGIDVSFAAAVGDWESFWPAFLERQRRVLGVLLRQVRPASPVPDRDWLAWTKARPAAKRRKERSIRTVLLSGGRRRIGVVLAVALALLGTLAFALVPTHLPGSVPDSRLTKRTAPRCVRCPAGERLAAVGYHSSDSRRYVNVVLAARPTGATLGVQLTGVRGEVLAQQVGSSSRWRVGVSRGAKIPTKDLLVQSRGRRVVVTLPDSLRARGVAVVMGRGDRLPASGFVSLKGKPPANVNVVDVVVLAFLLLAAWRGFRRGLVRFLPVLAGFLLTLLVARLLYGPLGAALRGPMATVPRVANAFAFGILFMAIGFGTYALGRKLSTTALDRLGARLPLREGTRSDSMFGAVAGVVRSSVVLAGALVLAVDLLALSRASESITSSVAGRGILAAWRLLYPGL